MNFKDRAKKHVAEKNLAWENYLIDCAHAGYNVKNSVTNRSMFMNGYAAGKAHTSSLEAQLAQAEDVCKQLQIDCSSQLASTQKALKGLYNAVQKSRSVNDPLGIDAAMEEAGRWF